MRQETYTIAHEKFVLSENLHRILYLLDELPDPEQSASDSGSVVSDGRSCLILLVHLLYTVQVILKV